MGSLIRLFVAAALVAVAIIVVAVGMATNDAALAAPAHLIVFVGLVVLYLLPTGIAHYRDCSAKGWITALNVLLGWTLFGWFIALGWAAGGKVRPVTRVVSTSRVHPVPGH